MARQSLSTFLAETGINNQLLRFRKAISLAVQTSRQARCEPIRKRRIGLILLLSGAVFGLQAQKRDTVRIGAGSISTDRLVPGIHRWLVYHKNPKDSMRQQFQLWTRTLEQTHYKGRPSILIHQKWENNDSIFHSSFAACDLKTFATFYHETWSKFRGTIQVDFTTRKIYRNAVELKETDTATQTKRILNSFTSSFQDHYLNWHLDLEVLPMLPYRENRTFVIGFYEPGLVFEPKHALYTVIGSAALTGYDGKTIGCWLLKHTSTYGSEVFWISKENREVLKLEQEFGGQYRYKVKLAITD